MSFYYGIEHEVGFINAQGVYADYQNTAFADYARIIDRLPKYDSDYPMLRVGDAGIKLKRWYIEGFERFNDQGDVTDCAPKGIEIRTTVKDSIDGAVNELSDSFRQLRSEAAREWYRPALISYHPFNEQFTPKPDLNNFERRRRNGSPEKSTASIPMMTHGPDLSLSCRDFSLDQTIHAARKLTAYSPYIIPFSFSSPFYVGKPWEGLSIRTYIRTGLRPAAMAFIDDPKKMLSTTPSLTQMARVPTEVGRIEFKAFDSCGNFALYAALLSLLKGIVLDEGALPLTANAPDMRLHQHSALHGFNDNTICKQAYAVLEAAYQALPDAEDRHRLDYLFTLLDKRTMPAKQMKQVVLEGGSINDAMCGQYP